MPTNALGFDALLPPSPTLPFSSVNPPISDTNYFFGNTKFESRDTKFKSSDAKFKSSDTKFFSNDTNFFGDFGFVFRQRGREIFWLKTSRKCYLWALKISLLFYLFLDQRLIESCVPRDHRKSSYLRWVLSPKLELLFSTFMPTAFVIANSSLK